MNKTEQSDSDSPTKCFKCTQKDCHARFSKSSRLKIHMRQHTNERPFECDFPDCDKTYTRAAHLKRHKGLSHCEKITESIICSFDGCGLSLGNKYALKKHQNRKHNPNNVPFQCNSCGKGFQRKKALQEHLFEHTGIPAFKCPKCTMAFNTEARLNKHQRLHKTYTCDCGTVFFRWTLLVTHKKSCKPKPELKCDLCNRTFNHSGNLNSHKMTHLNNTEKTSFKCTVDGCERSYFQKKNLTFHLNTYHKNKEDRPRFPCTERDCPKILLSKRCLTRHLQWHAKPKTDPKDRKARQDKGKPKKSMACFLSGLNLPKEDKILLRNDVNIIIQDESVSDDDLMKTLQMSCHDSLI